MITVSLIRYEHPHIGACSCHAIIDVGSQRQLATANLEYSEVMMSKIQSIPKIDTVMTPTPKVLNFDETLLEAENVMKSYDIRHLPIIEGHRLVGVVSDRDLRTAREIEKSAEYVLSVGEICTKDTYIVSSDTAIDEVVNSMAAEGIGSAIVVDKGEVVGIFTAVDACRCYGELLQKQYKQAINDALHT